MEKLVSIIVPVYKVEKYLQRCIKTLLDQTYKNVEIILIDDGSPDNCPKICDDLEARDCRVKVIHQMNRGPSAARNAGLKNCQGEYVTFLDSDDFLNIRTIQRWVELIEKYNANMIVGNFVNYYGKNKIDELINMPIKDDNVQIFNTEEILKEMFLKKHNLCVAWGKLYRKNIIVGYSFPETVFFGEDMYAAHILFEKAGNIIKDDFVGVYYSQEGESLVRSAFNIKKLDMIRAADEWLHFVIDNYPKLERAAFYRKTVIITNICGDLSCCNNLNAKNIFNQWSNWMDDNWNQIQNNPFFNSKDRFKALIVKYNMLSVMKVYSKIRKLL